MSEREPITTELRRYMEAYKPTVDGEHVEIARIGTIGYGGFVEHCDAIDAIHAGLERENAELRERVAVLDNKRGNMHDGWVRLPLDADGEYIHAGDVLDGYGKTIEVVEMRYGRSGWVLISRDGNGYADTFAFSHHHAPTVEDVLTKFGIDWEYEDNCEDRAALLAEYASKLRLANNEE